MTLQRTLAEKRHARIHCVGYFFPVALCGRTRMRALHMREAGWPPVLPSFLPACRARRLASLLAGVPRVRQTRKSMKTKNPGNAKRLEPFFSCNRGRRHFHQSFRGLQTRTQPNRCCRSLYDDTEKYFSLAAPARPPLVGACCPVTESICIQRRVSRNVRRVCRMLRHRRFIHVRLDGIAWRLPNDADDLILAGVRRRDAEESFRKPLPRSKRLTSHGFQRRESQTCRWVHSERDATKRRTAESKWSFLRDDEARFRVPVVRVERKRRGADRRVGG